MKRVAAVILLLVFGTLVGGNTMEGLGRDVERGGEKMQDSSKDARR